MKMIKFSVIIFVFLLLSAAFCYSGEKSRFCSVLEAGRKQVIVVYGTSLTSHGAWVKQLDEALEKKYPGLATVVNSGGSGKWSSWGVQNLKSKVIQKKPDVVFIEFCINDSVARFNCSVQRSKTNLETMIKSILKSNPKCEIILMTMTPGDKYPKGHRSNRKNIAAYYEMYRSVAKQRGFLLIDHYPIWKALQAKDRKLFDSYVPDSIHPTEAGCAKIITPVILHALGIKGGQGGGYDGPKDKLHIYLLIGQSNMAGRAPFTKEESAVIPRCYLLNDKDTMEPAKNPLNRYSTIRKGLSMQKMNPGYTFAQTMLDNDKTISVGLVVNAKGGSSIKQWTKKSRFYKEAVKRVNIAQKTGTLKGILWHQGESDAKDAQYLDKLKTLVGNLRKDFCNPKLLFVAGQINNVKLINDQIARLPKVVPFTGFASSKDLKAKDRWHFDAKSMRELGKRYAKQMLKLLVR